MVCGRCISVVTNELKSLGLEPVRVQLGEVHFAKPLEADDLDRTTEALKKHGFEVLDDRKSQIIEKIKNTVVEHIHHYQEGDPNYNFSTIISDRLNMDYRYLSALFSSTVGITIEKYIINQKIEKVKELLVYDELTLSEIAWRMGYSSVQHLSNQFKKVTGLTPSQFKDLKEKNRYSLDQI